MKICEFNSGMNYFNDFIIKYPTSHKKRPNLSIQYECYECQTICWSKTSTATKTNLRLEKKLFETSIVLDPDI